MENCLYNEKEICAYDVTNINQILNYDIYKEWKIAGENGKLKCPDCREEVILKVKDPRKKMPHFAHKIGSTCTYTDTEQKESEEHKRGKLKLYHYFKEKYEHVYINKSFSNKRRCDIYVEFDNKKLAVEFQRKNLEISEWEKRHKYYIENNINDLWIIGEESTVLMNNEKQIVLSEIEKIMLNECNKIAIYLDIKTEKICMTKNMRYKSKNIEGNDQEKLFSKIYNINDVEIKLDGTIECDDFFCKYEKAYKTFIEEKEKEEAEFIKQEDERKKYNEKLEEVKCNRKLEKSTYRCVEERTDKYTKEQFQVGTQIEHKTFGKSIITKIEEPFVTIKYGKDKEHRISLKVCLKGVIVKLIE